MAQPNQLAKGATGTEPNYTVQVEVDRALPVDASVIVYRNGNPIGSATETAPDSRRYILNDMEVANGAAVYTARVVDGGYEAPMSPDYGITVNAAVVAKVNLSSFTTDLRSVFFKKEEPFLPYDVDFDQEIVNRIMNANGLTGKFVFKENLTITYAHTTTGSGYQVEVTLTVIEDQYVYGTNTFTYQRLSPDWAYGDGSDQYAYATIYTDEIDATIAVRNWYQEQNIYPADYGDLGYVPVGSFANIVDMAHQRSLYWYLGPGFYDRITARFAFEPITPQPYEAEFDFSVLTTGVVQVVTDLINVGPTEMEVISAPAGFTDPIIVLNGLNTSVSLIPGTYRVRVFYPDSRKLKCGQFNNDYIQYSPSLRVTTLRKLRSCDCTSAFANMVTLTSILPTAFADGATYIGELYRTFQGCTGLTTLPAGLLNGVVRCRNFSSMFSHAGLTSLPSLLFSNLPKPIWQAGRREGSQCFWGCPLTALPSSLFHNIMGFAWSDMFLDCTSLTSLPADLFTGYQEGLPADSALRDRFDPLYQYSPVPWFDFDGTFQGCKLTSIPEALFTPFRGSDLPIFLTSTFSSNTTLTSIPAGLFDDLLVYHTNAYASTTNYQFNGTFSGCFGLTSIPEGLFDNLTEYPGDPYSGLYALGLMFQSCPNITSVPPNLLKNKPNLAYLNSTFSITGLTSVGADMFAGSPNIKEVRSLFSGAKLNAIPDGLFAGMTQLTTLEYVFSGTSQNYTSIPAGLLTGSNLLDDIQSLFSNSKITSIPPTLFDGLPLRTIVGAFSSCASLTTIPEGLFSHPTIRFASSVFSSSGLTSLPNKVFGTPTGDISLSQAFSNTQITVIPDEFLYGLDNISTAQYMFDGCPIDHVGPLIHNKAATTIDVQAMFRNCGAMTVDPNFIISDVVCTLTISNSVFGSMFYQSLPTAQVDTLFGDNIRIQGTSFFQGQTALTGSGNTFITKHAVPNTQTDLFAGCTGLSDFGSLPAWAL